MSPSQMFEQFAKRFRKFWNEPATLSVSSQSIDIAREVLDMF